jgi:hypothetical protein
MSDRRETITSVGPAFRSWRCRPPRAAVGICWVMQWMLPRQDLPAGRPISKASLPAAARSRRQMPAPRRGRRAQTRADAIRPARGVR